MQSNYFQIQKQYFKQQKYKLSSIFTQLYPYLAQNQAKQGQIQPIQPKIKQYWPKWPICAFWQLSSISPQIMHNWAHLGSNRPHLGPPIALGFCNNISAYSAIIAALCGIIAAILGIIAPYIAHMSPKSQHISALLCA